MPADLLLQGGRVIDPLHGVDGVADVAITGGKIGEVGPGLSTEGVAQVVDMVTTMNKVLAMGVPLPDVIARSTVAPAREIGHPELGHLGAGSDADVAVFALDDGQFSFVDCGPARLAASQRLRPVLTLRAGQIVYNPSGIGLAEWPEAPAEYWTLR